MRDLMLRWRREAQDWHALTFYQRFDQQERLHRKDTKAPSWHKEISKRTTLFSAQPPRLCASAVIGTH